MDLVLKDAGITRGSEEGQRECVCFGWEIGKLD